VATFLQGSLLVLSSHQCAKSDPFDEEKVRGEIAMMIANINVMQKKIVLCVDETSS
jgi:hypothetical protein